MTVPSPKMRPTVEEALNLFEKLVSVIPIVERKWRLVLQEDPIPVRRQKKLSTNFRITIDVVSYILCESHFAFLLKFHNHI